VLALKDAKEPLSPEWVRKSVRSNVAPAGPGDADVVARATALVGKLLDNTAGMEEWCVRR
jgi:hypothetical protein